MSPAVPQRQRLRHDQHPLDHDSGTVHSGDQRHGDGPDRCVGQPPHVCGGQGLPFPAGARGGSAPRPVVVLRGVLYRRTLRPRLPARDAQQDTRRDPGLLPAQHCVSSEQERASEEGNKLC